MNRDKSEVFSEAIFAFQLGIPWVFNPSKLKWTAEDTSDLKQALIDAGIIKFTSTMVSLPTQAAIYIIGVEDPKTITYMTFSAYQSIIGSKPFPSNEINMKIIGDKTYNPLEKTKPKLP
jgi:hypothetical protein